MMLAAVVSNIDCNCRYFLWFDFRIALITKSVTFLVTIIGTAWYNTKYSITGWQGSWGASLLLDCVAYRESLDGALLGDLVSVTVLTVAWEVWISEEKAIGIQARFNWGSPNWGVSGVQRRLGWRETIAWRGDSLITMIRIGTLHTRRA